MLSQQRQILSTGQQPQQPQTTQQANQIYRTWRQSTYAKGPEKAPEKKAETKKGDEDDLKNFYIKVAMHKDSIKVVSIKLLTLLTCVLESNRGRDVTNRFHS
jgi:hypothetical protein